MNSKKQKIAIFTVGVLLVFSIISGLILPYLRNNGNSTVDKGGYQNEEKIVVPDFQFTDGDGNTVNFDDFKGKPIVMNFWGTWCPWCVEEMDDFDRLVGEYGDKVNFIFLDVPNGEDETPQKVEQFLTDNGYSNITSYYDSMLQGCYMFGLNSFPVTVYVDSEGCLYNAAIGMTNYDDVKQIVDSML